MEIPVIYEDNDIVVIDKPSGVVSNRAETVKSETVQDWMASKLNLPIVNSQTRFDPDNIDYELYFRERYGLVHRLDKETSGLMVLAKNSNAFKELLRQFKEREIKKEYLALTHGLWTPKSGEISLPIGRARHDRQMMGIREDGRESVTNYEVEREWKNLSVEEAKKMKVNTKGYTGFTLVRFAPKTGRMHQIRVHARHVGHPLVGDDIYAGRKRSREDRKWCGRLMLQAYKLEITHPEKGSMKFESAGADIEKITKLLC